MLESMKNDTLEYVKMSPEEMKSRGILGRLVGPCCDTIRPTRNGRLYSNELWEKVFNSPLVKEQFNAGGIFGELTHPDRDEVALEKVAISMPQPPKKNKDGYLVGVWDILDTPCGRILQTLCSYGYKVGISTRGTGDITTDYDGNECVDPDTYTLNAMDIVTIPAVEAARLEYVNESLQKNDSLSESLSSLIDKSTDEDKKIMVETLENLDIHLPSKKDGVNIDATTNSVAADNDGANVVKSLQEALKENKRLQSKIASLQEKLSVCYAKETKQEETIAKCRETVSKLSQAQKVSESLKTRISTLHEKVKTLEENLSQKEEELTSLKEHLATTRQRLSEEISAKDKSIKALSTKVNEISTTNKRTLTENEAKYNKATLQLQEQLKNSEKKISDLSEKYSHANKLVEKYKAIAKNAVEKYISTQAIRLGVKPEEIKSRLREGYTFNDIDNVCEELQNYHVSVSRLPFSLGSNKSIGVSITESREPMTHGLDSRFDDDVDEALIELAKVK